MLTAGGLEKKAPRNVFFPKKTVKDQSSLFILHALVGNDLFMKQPVVLFLGVVRWKPLCSFQRKCKIHKFRQADAREPTL